jgi:UDP:flavonoid glycosyltransferase YjiC (YdhE family)
VAASAETGQPIIYLHHGRTFDSPSFWDQAALALSERPVRVAASIGRMDRPAALPDDSPNFFVRPHLSQGAVLAKARMVIAGGNTTAVLGALTHGLPSLLIPGGGEQHDVADQVVQAGAGLALPNRELTAAALDRALDEVLARADLSRRAQVIGEAFSRAPGPTGAARLIERLAATRSPVSRRAVAAAAGIEA